MKVPFFLKKLLTSFVEIYEFYFFKTIKATFVLTVICFGIAELLNLFTSYDLAFKSPPISILSFFFLRYSINDTYCFVDNVKTVFVFLVSIFSINFYRNLEQNPKRLLIKISNKLTVKDALYLLAILATCTLLDCALFRFEGQLKSAVSNHHLLNWLRQCIFFLRIYLPLILFSIIIQICISKTSFTFRQIAFLLMSLWICNEMAYEVTTLIRVYLFGLMLIPLNSDTFMFVFESILGTGLIAAFFLGYYCAMTTPFNLVEEHNGDV